MKREDITKVFPEATKEQIDALLDVHSADIGKVKGDYDTLKGQLDTANGTIKTLRDTVKQFDGVDVAALKQSVTDWEKKYNDDTAALRLSAAIDRSLAEAGARNPRLLSAALDKTKLKLEGDTVTGLSQQLEAVRKSDPYLFKEEPGSGSSTGVSHGGTVPDFSALSDEEYYKLTMKQTT